MQPVYINLIMVLVLLLALLVGWKVRQRFITNSHRRAKVNKFFLFYAAIVLAVVIVSKCTGPRPFSARDAISIGCWLVFLGCMYYSWLDAKRKAALEPAPPPTPLKPPTFLWQAVLILLPVVVMTVIGFVALMRDRNP